MTDKPKRGRTIRQKIITRIEVRANPDRLYAFGDNVERAGYGGQARAMRGEPNAVGIPTKFAPNNRPEAFFTDAVLDDPVVMDRIIDAFSRLYFHLDRGGDVVVPADGIGTGLAELPVRAPRFYARLQELIGGLERP